MSPIKVITSGSAYLDIDAYACCIAYAELLNLQGIPARAGSSAKPNASVSKTVLGWGTVLEPSILRKELLKLSLQTPRHKPES